MEPYLERERARFRRSVILFALLYLTGLFLLSHPLHVTVVAVSAPFVLLGILTHHSREAQAHRAWHAHDRAGRPMSYR